MATEIAAQRQLGLLTKNVFQSPEILFVFPIQIRSPRHHDVALIGEHHVEIKQIIAEDGRFEHVASRNDFGSRIHAAAVVGNAYLCEDHYENDRKSGVIDGTMCPCAQENPEWPAQGLLLTLESGRMVFVTMQWNQESSHFSFVEWSTSLPNGIVEIIAVDAYSRAIAAASRTGDIFLCGCSTGKGLVTPTASITGRQHIIHVELYISKIDFLFPSSSNDHTVRLIVAGSDSTGRLQLKVFEWRPDGPDSPFEINVAVEGGAHRGEYRWWPDKLRTLLIFVKCTVYLMSSSP